MEMTKKYNTVLFLVFSLMVICFGFILKDGLGTNNWIIISPVIWLLTSIPISIAGLINLKLSNIVISVISFSLLSALILTFLFFGSTQNFELGFSEALRQLFWIVLAGHLLSLIWHISFNIRTGS